MRSICMPYIENQIRDYERGSYTVKRAAVYLGVSEKSIRRLVQRGILRPSKAFRKLLIPREQIERFFENTS